MKIEDFRPIRSQDSAPIKFDWLLMQESDWIIWTNQKMTLMIFWLVKNGKDWNPAIPLVKRIFLVPDHIWPKTIKGQPALTHVIRNYVLLLVVPPLCLWWVTHVVTKALRLKILPGQQLPLFPNPPTLHYEQTSVKYWNSYIFLQEKVFENIICKMSAILSQPQCVKMLDLLYKQDPYLVINIHAQGPYCTWWRHQMETFSTLLAICAGNSPVTSEFPAQRPVTLSFDVFFDLHLNKWLNKQ